MYYVVVTHKGQEQLVLGCWDFDKAMTAAQLYGEGQKPFEDDCVTFPLQFITVVERGYFEGDPE